MSKKDSSLTLECFRSFIDNLKNAPRRKPEPLTLIEQEKEWLKEMIESGKLKGAMLDLAKLMYDNFVVIPEFPIDIVVSDLIPEDTIMAIPPIPVGRFEKDGVEYEEDLEVAVKRHAREHPEQFGKIVNIKTKGEKGDE